MKNILMQLVLALFIVFEANAQAPQRFNYQGIARDVSGAPIVSTGIGIRLTIHDNDATGPMVYQEKQVVATNDFGVFYVAIGGGDVLYGSFASIDWAVGDKYLEVEIDPSGGSAYMFAGVNQLLSVPYAMYAGSTSSSTGGTVTSVSAGTGLTGGTITTSGTIGMPSVGTAGTYGSSTQIPVFTVDPQGRVTGVTNTAISVPGVSGTTNYVSKYTSSTAIGNSLLYDNGTSVGIGTTSPVANTVLDVRNTSTLFTARSVYGKIGTGSSYSLTEPAGIFGDASAGNGVTGASAGRNGVYGVSTVPGYAGVLGSNTATGSGGIGVKGIVSGSGTAGYFDGGTNGNGIICLSGADTAGKFNSSTGIGVYSKVGGTGSVAGFFDGGGNGDGIVSQTNSNHHAGFFDGGLFGTAIKGRVSGTNFAGIFDGGANGVGISAYVSGTSTTGIAGKFDGGTNGKAIIVPNGPSGFGTTSPTAILHVEGTSTATTTIGSTTVSNLGALISTGWAPVSSNVHGLECFAGNSNTGNYAFTSHAEGAGASDNRAIQGVAGPPTGSTTSGICIGVWGKAENGAQNYGVYGVSAGSGSGIKYAGYFFGDVQVVGSLAKSSGTFKIDHPLDPENKYLYHSFVESPDMKNIYDGNVVTDANGDAMVTMPDYFGALNKDFRYQLTVIGTFAQAIVNKEISGNTFTIKTDKPNVKVSWQVTGIRKDKYAEAHRVVPEVEKEPEFKGRYLNAQEWGMPESKSIDELTKPKDGRENQHQAQ